VTPDQVRAWQAIFRDVVITVLAAFMLTYETVGTDSPNVYVIGAGLTLLGIPPALRLDSMRRKQDEREDPYDGPGGYFRE
jgi:hypothetical protein